MKWNKKQKILKLMENVLYKNNRNLLYLICQKYAANQNSSVRKTNQNRLMLLSNLWQDKINFY